MLIRKLEKKDYKQFVDLLNEFRPIGMDISQDIFNNIYNEILKNSIIYVIEKDEELIGSAKLIIEQKFIHKLAKYGYVEDVIVKKKYRGKGVGKMLVKEIVDYCKENNFYKIILTCNKDLVSFYEKNNFEIYDIHMSQLL